MPSRGYHMMAGMTWDSGTARHMVRLRLFSGPPRSSALIIHLGFDDIEETADVRVQHGREPPAQIPLLLQAGQTPYIRLSTWLL